MKEAAPTIHPAKMASHFNLERPIILDFTQVRRTSSISNSHGDLQAMRLVPRCRLAVISSEKIDRHGEIMSGRAIMRVLNRRRSVRVLNQRLFS